VLAAERRWQESEEQFRRAIELNPGYLTAHHWYGWLLAHLARHDEAIEYLRGAKALDPLSHIVRTDLAAAYYHARRYEEAIEEAEACVETRLCSNHGRVHGRALLALGRPEEALAVATDDGRAVERVLALAALGRDEEARGGLRAYRESGGGTGDGLSFPITHLGLAEMYTALGDLDEALASIERAQELGLATGPILIREWPTLDPIRDHPRFRAVVDRLDRPVE
jgi:tetratricopeptide (TPR) repeat protein